MWIFITNNNPPPPQPPPPHVPPPAEPGLALPSSLPIRCPHISNNAEEKQQPRTPTARRESPKANIPTPPLQQRPVQNFPIQQGAPQLITTPPAATFPTKGSPSALKDDNLQQQHPSKPRGTLTTGGVLTPPKLLEPSDKALLTLTAIPPFSSIPLRHLTHP